MKDWMVPKIPILILSTFYVISKSVFDKSLPRLKFGFTFSKSPTYVPGITNSFHTISIFFSLHHSKSKKLDANATGYFNFEIFI